MPHIPVEDRAVLLPTSPEKALAAGELNYQITEVVKSYLKCHRPCYQTYNDIIGALEGAKLELYRLKVADYEDLAIIRNGSVYQEPTGKTSGREASNE